VLLVAQQVTACHAPVLLSGPEKPQCLTCDFYSYTIKATSAGWDEQVLRVTDTLPAGLNYIPGSSITEPMSGIDPQWDESTRTLTWDFYNVPANTWRNITFRVKATNPIPVTNSVKTFVKAPSRVNPHDSWEMDKYGHIKFVESNTVTTPCSKDVCPSTIPDPVAVPEFPTTIIPAGLIAGLMGAALFIRQYKGE